MLEILVAAALCSWVSRSIKAKGRSVPAYIALTLGLWFGLTVWDEYYSAYLLGLGGAILGGIMAAVLASRPTTPPCSPSSHTSPRPSLPRSLRR